MLEIEPVSTKPSSDGWLVRWRVRNIGSAALAIQSAWLPHSRFRSQEQHFDPPLVVPPGDESALESVVAWDGEAVENAFLILRTDAGRIFSRLRLEAGPAPRVFVEVITDG